MRWGLVPHWAKDLKIGARMINARAETVATMPAFRDALNGPLLTLGRCLAMVLRGERVAIAVLTALLTLSVSGGSLCRAEEVIGDPPLGCTPDFEPRAAFRRGVALDMGGGAAQDFSAAAECYRVAAAAGDSRAEFMLAAMYDNGRGVPRDLAAAEFWYGEAALRGDARAAYALGLMCETGAIRPPDPTTALSWYREAWSRGIAAAGPKIVALERAAAGPRPKVPASAAATPNDAAEGPPRDFVDQTGRTCRHLATVIVVEGRAESAYGTVCRDATGRWVLLRP